MCVKSKAVPGQKQMLSYLIGQNCFSAQIQAQPAFKLNNSELLQKIGLGFTFSKFLMPPLLLVSGGWT